MTMVKPIDDQFDNTQRRHFSNNAGGATFLQFAHAPGGREVVEFMVVLSDLSPSMLSDDLKPSRLEVALAADGELIRTKAAHHPKDVVAVIGFGGTARFLHGPVAVGKNVEHLLQSLDRVAYIDGTNFHAALTLAESVFPGSEKLGTKVGRGLRRTFSRLLGERPSTTSRATHRSAPNRYVERIILLSDGQRTQGPSPVPVAERLKRAGVIIDCIGIADRAEVDEAALKAIASKNPDGSARYCFIQDRQSLIRKYEALAGHIRVMEE
jgi:hypothetical protein